MPDPSVAGGATGGDVADTVVVKNTFLEFFNDNDPWLLDPKDCRRQKTDSVILDRSSLSRLSEFDHKIEGATPSGHYTDDEIGVSQNRYARFIQEMNGMDLPKAPLQCNVPNTGLLRGNSFRDVQPRRQTTPEDEPGPEPSPPAAISSTSSAEDSKEREKEEAQIDPATENAETKPKSFVPVPGGMGGNTTVMLRNVPCKYTQRKLMREINGSGYLGRFDFIYLPMDPRNRANRGFAFCNFDSPEIAEQFYQAFHGKKLRNFTSEVDVLEVLPADIQGFETNAEHYLSSHANRRNRATNSRPLFLRPLPPHLSSESTSVGEYKPTGMSGLLHASQVVGVPPWLQQGQCAGMVPQMAPAIAVPAFQAVFKQPCGANAPPQNSGFQVPAPGRFPGGKTKANETRKPLQSSKVAQQVEPPPAGNNLVARFCPYCGKPKQADFSFCPFCGNQQPQQQPQQQHPYPPHEIKTEKVVPKGLPMTQMYQFTA